MKIILTVLFTSLMTLTPLAHGDTYKTLSSCLDTVTIPAGQVAFIISASSQVRLGVAHDGKREQQYRFEGREFNSQFQITARTYPNRLMFPQPTMHNPVPIAGPAKLTLRTSGLITLSLPEQARRRSSSSSGRPTVRRFAKN